MAHRFIINNLGESIRNGVDVGGSLNVVEAKRKYGSLKKAWAAQDRENLTAEERRVVRAWHRAQDAKKRNGLIQINAYRFGAREFVCVSTEFYGDTKEIHRKPNAKERADGVKVIISERELGIPPDRMRLTRDYARVLGRTVGFRTRINPFFKAERAKGLWQQLAVEVDVPLSRATVPTFRRVIRAIHNGLKTEAFKPIAAHRVCVI